MKAVSWWLAGFSSFVLVNAGFAQGTVWFSNNSGNAIITNCHTRLQQAPRTIKIGLYFTTDLSAVSNTAALASMQLVAVTTNAPIAALGGRFNGGNVRLPGVPIGSNVVLQIKAWPTNYVAFEDAGAEVAVSLPWVQPTGGSVFPPTIIYQWGFRPFLFPQCEPPRVPLFVEHDGTKVRVRWPIGLPPTVQMNDGSSTKWQTIASGTFVDDHWEFEVTPTAGVRLFRLAQ